MTEEMTSLAVEDAPNPGTVSFTPEPKEVKPPTAREAIEKSLQAIEEKEGKIPEADELRDKKPELKPKLEAKTEPKEEAPEPKQAKERAPDGKFTKSNEDVAKAFESEKPITYGGTGENLDAPKPPAGERDINRAPDNFLPRAKEKWPEAPEEVRGEFYRALENFEKGKAEYQEDREFRKAIKPYEEMAKQYGTSVQNYLENTLRINQHLSQDLVGGLDVIARQYGYTLEQVAQHITQQAQVQQQNPQLAHTQRLEQQITQLQQQLQQMGQMTAQQQQEAQRASAYREVEQNIITPFKQSHPRYEELQGDIAFFLNSDKIPSNLSAQSRLEEAYFMAERLNPAPTYTNKSAQRPINPAGEKSIKGSLTSGTDVYAAKGAKLNGREAIEAAMNQLDLR